jgi:cytochrome P450
VTTTLRGRDLSPGERVYLAYESGNRDEEVFDNPYVFDITAPRGQQASFGFGTHVCIGAAFARLEATALLRELVTRSRTSSWPACRSRWSQSCATDGTRHP